MTAAFVDIDYSVEKWFADNWSATDVHYQGNDFDDTDLTDWVSVHVLTTVGGATRDSDYQGTTLISVNVFSRTSRRAAIQTAQVLEASLRAANIVLYDETDSETALGYLRLKEPALKASREVDNLHAVTLDVHGELNM